MQTTESEHKSPPLKKRKCNGKKGTIDNSVKFTDTVDCVVTGSTPTPGPVSSTNKGMKGAASKANNGIFSGHNIFILQAGIGKARTDLFKKQVINNGGSIDNTLCANTSFIVVDEKMDMDRLCRILKTNNHPECVEIVKSIWLSACLKETKLINTSEFTIKPLQLKIEGDIISKNSNAKQENILNIGEHKDEHQQHRYQISNKSHDGGDLDSDYNPSDDEKTNQTDATTTKRPLPKGAWACAQASGQVKVNHNQDITDKLEALAEIYENTNDRWRALGYKKGIAALKRYHRRISTFEEAKSIDGVGDKLASKIWEIIESGELRKLDEISSSEEVQAINLFTKVWGAGAATARQWISLGYRNLDDIRTKAKLTRHQEIGLRHFDDLNDRMDHAEAGRIADIVAEAATVLDPGLVCMGCGSYRRGKATCGDVDVLITHPDGRSHAGVFAKLLNYLHTTGFLTDDLVMSEDNGSQKKYMGVCRLPGEDTKYRRLDIIVVPYDEYACAVMYFTGSAHFNRSMRHLAGKMGMSLSEHSLNIGVVRNRGEKITKGTPLPTPTEESVFQHFGLPYRTPEQRNH